MSEDRSGFTGLLERRPFGVALGLFLVTVVTVTLARGPAFAMALLAILVAHESGHYFAARWHGIPTSPPLFIPVPPQLFLFGTMGAVILAPPDIRRRNQLFDFAAAGPLAGLCVAVPLLVFGLSMSEVGPNPPHAWLEGRSLFYLAIRDAVVGPIPPGQDVQLTDVAFAGWAGLLVTMVNLLPVGQLDGGHIAYALLGDRQDVWSTRFLYALPFVALCVSVYEASTSLIEHAPWSEVVEAAKLGLTWLFWFVLLLLMRRLAGAAHPPTDDDELSRGRRVLGWFTLALFPLLFMPWFLRVLP